MDIHYMLYKQTNTYQGHDLVEIIRLSPTENSSWLNTTAGISWAVDLDPPLPTMHPRTLILSPKLNKSPKDFCILQVSVG